MQSEPITAAHIRAARGFLAISQGDLAAISGLSRTTIKDVEAGGALPTKSGAIIADALADLGITISADGLTVSGALS